VQQKQYDLGEETVHRFGLLPEEAATLQLAKWVDDTALTRASTDVDNGVSGAANRSSSTEEGHRFSALCAPLPPLTNALLCIDIAVTSVSSGDMARQLLDRVREYALKMDAVNFSP
jgi:zinc finger FYVE domain-containing protein 26